MAAGSRRFTDDQFRAQDNGVGHIDAGGTVEVADKIPGRDLSHFVTGIIDRGKVWFHDGGYGVVIEAGKGDIGRDADAPLFEGHHAADRTIIIGDEYGVRQWGHLPDDGGGFGAGLLAQVADDDIIFSVRN